MLADAVSIDIVGNTDALCAFVPKLVPCPTTNHKRHKRPEVRATHRNMNNNCHSPRGLNRVTRRNDAACVEGNVSTGIREQRRDPEESEELQ